MEDDAAEGAGRPVDRPTRLRLDIAYDGSNFTGWGTQPGIRTVQGEIEGALGVILRRHAPIPRLVVAGRTDAGVHAIGQVAHLDLTPAQLSSLDRPRRGKMAGRRFDGPASLGRRINGIAGLNSDVHIATSALAPPGFDARFSALSRRYEYRIADMLAPRNPLERHRTLWYPARLDLDAMNAAAVALVGLHDWAAFCKPREGATTVRTLQEFRWERAADGVLIAQLEADAFCHSMVRALVGACVAVGERKLGPDRLLAIRDEITRSSDFKVMPAKGLNFVAVNYPPDHELGARAELTRRRRPSLEAARIVEATSAPGLTELVTLD